MVNDANDHDDDDEQKARECHENNMFSQKFICIPSEHSPCA
jgi:hypothetical protein